ncbi:helix-turn-helix domain-containing protein [Rhodoblastus acidophilus]|uniref:Helix-turn-helix domain-containing protein n=1 Tax=Candidatus Rhodoblastus alkanivorans TaxID=2954117 RepID=A0ABS9Z4D5_9HYPH|nr:helix-turn-helix domain-containing protein [Candidatus Rhodoblastus alkanivorans]MDI4639845.1 helix-turn-helix domain-containing protein [Rhodoblastus acidophilus]
MSDRVQSRLSTELKVQIVQRVEAGERLSAVAKEIGVLRKSIYEWRAAYRTLGAAGLNQKRGPKPDRKRKSASTPGAASSDAASSSAPPDVEAKPMDELGRAQARIAELERIIGRQQADLHFFREALRLWDAKSPKSGAPTSAVANAGLCSCMTDEIALFWESVGCDQRLIITISS